MQDVDPRFFIASSKLDALFYPVAAFNVLYAGDAQDERCTWAA